MNGKFKTSFLQIYPKGQADPDDQRSDNQRPDNQLPDNQIPDNRLPDNQLPDNHIPDKWRSTVGPVRL
jgi:hypothetical protein